MALFTKSLLVASAAILLAGPAAAASGELLTAKFLYLPQQSAAVNYASFRRVAVAACRFEYRDIVSLGQRARYQRLCARDLLDRAVNGARQPQLVSLHRGEAAATSAAALAALR